jgi:hypothetical protein
MSQSLQQPDVAHVIESAGVDWITATAQKGSTRWEMQTYADDQRRRFMDSGETIKSGYRLGYYGWTAEGFFHGNREGGSIVVASGATAHEVFRSVVNVSDHISRLDLQVTVSTPIDKPNLAAQAYAVLKGGSPASIRVKNVTYIETHPQGATCNVGKRKSDTYGRIYDKASESGEGAARSRWRYEVETKRGVATSLSRRLAGDPIPTSASQALVFDWYYSRGVAPIFKRAPISCPHEPTRSPAGRSVLLWFRDSLSITVRRAVKRYGLVEVIEALGLVPDIDLFMKEVIASGTWNRRSLPIECDAGSINGKLPAKLLVQE